MSSMIVMQRSAVIGYLLQPGVWFNETMTAIFNKERHMVECFFEKLKEFRRIATRYDKLSIAFRASVMIAACLIWLQ